MKLKRSKIILLPTDKYTNGDLLIHQAYDDQQLWLTEADDMEDEEIWVPSHLYFTTDDKPKEGDWMLDTIENDVIERSDALDVNGYIEKYCRKIIASSDKSLNLPQPSDSFVIKYCKSTKIDEVNVEYEWEQSCVDADDGHIFGIKVDRYNTIIIHPVKDNWNREEVENLLTRITSDVFITFRNKRHSTFDLDNWKKMNLK